MHAFAACIRHFCSAKSSGHCPICGAAAGAEGVLVISVETSGENNWSDLYYRPDRGESWQVLELPWEDAQLDGVGFLYRVSWLRQQDDGSWKLCLTQEPTGVKGYDWCAIFTAQMLEGSWTYQAKQPDPASR